MCKLKNIFYGFYAKEIYINFLDEVSEILRKDQSHRYLLNYNLVLRKRIKDKFGNTDVKIDSAKNYLINAGYLVLSGTHVLITEEGSKFLTGYHRFRMMGFWGKFTTIFNRNFISITAISSLIIAFLALLKR